MNLYKFSTSEWERVCVCASVWSIQNFSKRSYFRRHVLVFFMPCECECKCVCAVAMFGCVCASFDINSSILDLKILNP